MKWLPPFSLVLILSIPFVFATCETQHECTPPALQEHLVGQWEYGTEVGDNFFPKLTYEFKADGTYTVQPTDQPTYQRTYRIVNRVGGTRSLVLTEQDPNSAWSQELELVDPYVECERLTIYDTHYYYDSEKIIVNKVFKRL